MTETVAPQHVVDLETGLISRGIYSDGETYDLEMERIFHRCWLFLGHESQIPRPGDFVTNYTGEDPVIVWRDARGAIHAFLNTCLHRGNKVCLYDAGRAASLTCSYHGWTYDSEGKLVGVPFFEEAYYGELDRENWGLVEVPKVASYEGLIFGCWDAGAISLEDYLGDLRWYLENVLLINDMGALEVLPGCQRYSVVGNWKFFCDNFAGDGYHVPTSHASAFAVGASGSSRRRDPDRLRNHMLHFAPAHTLGALSTDLLDYENDLANAPDLGAEVVEYVTERRRRQEERMRDLETKPYGWTWGHCFPNLCLQGFNTALRARVVALCHPRGPQHSEVWQYSLIEAAAPRAVKELAARTALRGQSGSGLIGVDDSENFERINENTLAPMSRKLNFHYAMGMQQEGAWPGSETWNVKGLPGLFGPRISETGQRRFYAYWVELMSEG